MSEVKKQLATMSRITNLAAAVLDKDAHSIRGFDMQAKGVVSYLVKKITNFDDGHISTFYRIPVSGMRDRWEDIEIRLQVDDAFNLELMKVIRIWNTLTFNSISV